MRLGAIINPEAGDLPPEQSRSRLEAILSELQPKIASADLVVASGSDLARRMASLKSREIDVLIVGGGDGTISNAVRTFAGTGPVFLPLAMGTRNHFARDLGMPLDPIQALRDLDRMRVSRIDLGEVNGQVFINNATVGVYPRFVAARKRRMRGGWRKWQANLAAVVVVLRQMRSFRIAIDAEGCRVRRLTPFLFVGNNEYEGEPFGEFLRPSLSAGTLWVCTARVTGFRSLLGVALRLGSGTLVESDRLDARLVQEMTACFRRRWIAVALDGENVLMRTPLHFVIRKQRLKVMVP